MSYKTILVHFDGSRQRRERLELAFNTAERYDAHLVAGELEERRVLPSE